MRWLKKDNALVSVRARIIAAEAHVWCFERVLILSEALDEIWNRECLLDTAEAILLLKSFKSVGPAAAVSNVWLPAYRRASHTIEEINLERLILIPSTGCIQRDSKGVYGPTIHGLDHILKI